MNPSALDEMRHAEDHHWWFVGTRDIICDVLAREHQSRNPGRKLLDVGCGTGYTLARAQQMGFDVSGCDTSNVALDHARARGLSQLQLVDAERLPYEDSQFDALLCLDVLEHIKDDKAAARELQRVLKPDGTAVIAVPAGPWLFGPHDRALGHLRRYTKRRFQSLLQEAGFELEHLSYYNGLLAPLAVPARIWAKMRGGEASTDVTPVPGPLNAALHFTLASERWLMRLGGLPFGISLIAVARKKPAG